MKIKLRAWNQLAEGGEIVTEENSGLKSYQILERFSNVMQWITLKDKNGTEIYEGDIISINDWVAVIVWDNTQWAIASGPMGNYHTYDYFTSEIMKGVEVVGNIYENPDYQNLKV